MNNKNLQWHPAFYAGIQIEFADEADRFVFENEHSLGTKPKQIDVLIIKKGDDTPIQKNIGRNVRKYSIEFVENGVYYVRRDFFLYEGT